MARGIVGTRYLAAGENLVTWNVTVDQQFTWHGGTLSGPERSDADRDP